MDVTAQNMANIITSRLQFHLVTLRIEHFRFIQSASVGGELVRHRQAALNINKQVRLAMVTANSYYLKPILS